MIRRLVAFALAILVPWVVVSPARPQSVVLPGGLTSLPGIYALGPDLTQNGGFETNDGIRPTGWTMDSAWAVDSTTRHSGSWSVRLSEAPAVPFAQIARQNLTLRRGLYKLSGWIKTQDLGANTANSGVRLNLDYSAGAALMRGLTPIIRGTNDWTYFETTNIVVPEDRAAVLKLEAYLEPSGTAWFDDVRVEEQLPAPVEMFVLYPNYRGMLFEDQPSTISIDVTVSPPGGNFGAYDVVVTLKDGPTAVATRTYAAGPVVLAELDGTAMQFGRLYDVSVSLVSRSGGAAVYTAPVYRLSRVPASARSAMKVAFDHKNRILLHGTPRFILGVYDSGIGYSTTDSYWEDTLWASSGKRRMDGLRINMYLNYHFGLAPTTAMNALMTNLQKRGVMYLQTGNCFQSTPASNFQIDASDDYVRTLGSHAGSAGYYTFDECTPAMIPGVFTQYKRLGSLDPDSMTFGALLASPPEVFLWADTGDVLSTDPYPLYGTEGSGYPHRMVADWTAINREAVMNARPFMTVLQFFKFTSAGRWPTLVEMRNHAAMAVVEGARGLMWWSLGAGALAYACNPAEETVDAAGWCDTRTRYMTNLKTLVGELAALEPALVADDTPSALTANSQAAAIQTKVKTIGGTGYVFAYNRTSSAVTATFTWHRAPTTITVTGETLKDGSQRTLTPTGSSFTDTFTANAAHIYVIATPNETAPAAPSALTAAATASRIDLAWRDESSNETGFKIERSTGTSGFTQIASVAANVASYADTTVTGGTSYTYRVRAFNNAGDSAYSNEASATTPVTLTPPAAPSGLSATAAAGSRVNLAWIDNSGNESGFAVFRSSGGGVFTEIGRVGANVRSFSDATGTPRVTYQYRVQAFNDAGASSFSNTVSVRTRK